MIDYHIHTPLCNHAQGSMTAMVHSALEQGFREICFLDHLIVDGPGMKHSMAVEEVPLYMQSIAHLRRVFKEKITLRAGLEVDFIPEKIDVIQKVIDCYDFDVIGASVHFVDGVNVASRRAMPSLTHEEKQRLVLRYFEQLDLLLEHDFFDVICHPDVVKKTGVTIGASADPLIDRFLNKVAQKNVTLEFNAGGWEHPARESYPSEVLARKCHKKGIAFTVGSDAHSPEKLGIHVEKAGTILKQIGYAQVNTFEHRMVRPVPL